MASLAQPTTHRRISFAPIRLQVSVWMERALNFIVLTPSWLRRRGRGRQWHEDARLCDVSQCQYHYPELMSPVAFVILLVLARSLGCMQMLGRIGDETTINHHHTTANTATGRMSLLRQIQLRARCCRFALTSFPN